MCDDRDTQEVRSHRVDLMSYIKWCDVIGSAYDVIYIVAVMSYIHRV